jgi:hypothetical protein
MIEEHEEQLLEAFRSFLRLERTLRRRMGEGLSAHLGTRWSEYIPGSIRERIEERMRDSLQNDLIPARDSSSLEFADFGELVSIVGYFWDEVFHTWFPDKDTTLGLFDAIRGYRNALMHSVLLPKDGPVLVGLCLELTKQLEATAEETVPSTPDRRTSVTARGSGPQTPKTEAQSAFHHEISATLGEMTGLFEGERDALLTCIESNLSLCTPVLLEQIRHKFISLPDTATRIDALVDRLPPRRPSPPEPKWKLKVAKWLKWAANSYLPYRYWMMINDQVDDAVEAMSGTYEAWLYDSYADLLRTDPKRFVYGSYLLITRLLEQNPSILWVLVDNLPLFSQTILVKLLTEHGFRIKEMIRQIAMLPSETSTSRKSALVGRLPDQIPEGVSETDALLEAWQTRTDKRVVVINSLHELGGLDQHRADLFIYVYSRLDSLWHTPSSKDFERGEEIEVALARLVARLSDAMTRLEQKDPALLVISTDHGSTYLRPQSERLSVPSSATKDATYEEHRRFIRISRHDALNDVEWFYLDKDEFHLHHSCAVARGWRYIDVRPRGFTHGGLTPEETVVPMLVCELGESEFERLQPIYEQATDPLRLGRPGKLAIRVRNPYRMPIEDLQISLSDYGVTFPSTDVKSQMEAVTEAIDFQLPAKMQVEQDAVFVNLTVRFVAGGQPRSHPAKLRIKVRQLFKTDLDDDFGAVF